ncbi:MAG TPA: hypothetical protein VKR79_03475 [Gaiellaceae bacterium]|nr:hypothetical protein [Gaiellaceae bacterium]
MPRKRKDSKEARITPYAKMRLEELVDKLATTEPVLPVNEADLVGALVDAARRSPLEAVKAHVQAYRDVQLKVDAAEIVGAFLRALS